MKGKNIRLCRDLLKTWQYFAEFSVVPFGDISKFTVSSLCLEVLFLKKVQMITNPVLTDN